MEVQNSSNISSEKTLENSASRVKKTKTKTEIIQSYTVLQLEELNSVPGTNKKKLINSLRQGHYTDRFAYLVAPLPIHFERGASVKTFN